MRIWPLEGPHAKQCLNLVSTSTTQTGKFTVDTKMSCLRPSSCKVARSGKDANLGMFHTHPPQSTYIPRPSEGTSCDSGWRALGNWFADIALHSSHTFVCLFSILELE